VTQLCFIFICVFVTVYRTDCRIDLFSCTAARVFNKLLTYLHPKQSPSRVVLDTVVRCAVGRNAVERFALQYQLVSRPIAVSRLSDTPAPRILPDLSYAVLEAYKFLSIGKAASLQPS